MIWIENNEELISVNDLVIDFNKPRLTFDFDGVYTKPEFLKSTLFLKKGYDININETGKSYAQKLMLKQKPHKTKEEIELDYLSVVEFLYVDWMHKIKPREFIKEVMENFKDKYQIFIVTSRRSINHGSEIKSVYSWLKSNNVNFDYIINTNNKSKKDYLKMIKPLIFIDDSLEKIVGLFKDDTCQKLDLDLRNTAFYLFRNITNYDVQIVGKIKVIEEGWLGLEKEVNNLLKTFI